jgi:hypothetical protein
MRSKLSTSELNLKRKLSDVQRRRKPGVTISLIPEIKKSSPHHSSNKTKNFDLFLGSTTEQARERATELFMNASSFFSGVLK